MPDVHVAFTIPAAALWCALAYLAFGLVTYLPVTAWINLRLISSKRPPLEGANPLRAAAWTVGWIPLGFLIDRDRRKTRAASARLRAEVGRGDRKRGVAE